MAGDTRCIAIVGAGFSGTMTAVNLLRRTHVHPLGILLIDKEHHGRGLAYADHPSHYLLNVPAGRMSAVSDDPEDFLRFARKSLPQADAEDFLPRALYGDYLEDTLRRAELESQRHVKLERIRGDVRSIEIWRPTLSYILHLEAGRELTASEVVLAMGNPAPAQLPQLANLRDTPYLIERPLSAGQSSLQHKSVLIVGTGLTMADVALSTLQSAEGASVVHAISRHGLLPPRQTAFRNAHAQFDAQPLLRAASISMRSLFHAVREIAAQAEERGGDWREAITFVRTLATRLWISLSATDRRRFLRHARPYWEIHRHRLPPSSRSALDELRRAQRLHILGGRLLDLKIEGEQVRVTWRPRGQRQNASFLVDRVVNCTGPDYRCRNSSDALIRDLLAHGLIQADALGTGLCTESAGRVVNQLGHVTRGLYYVGPMLRAGYWEATAVQELREHAERLAHRLSLTRNEWQTPSLSAPSYN